ncbi:MAG TPA: TonB-dependent receptor, partial [Caulobacteraceae bacterium]|nr:TonB-dependent receptor [Caulobacteraceae bacterium]
MPIAISAFTQESLTTHQIAGGPDLITQVPNMTFTKTNFSSYSVQLRGIGTQAISATTDPAVAVAFNNTPFIRNRFFEQEFYDLQRVEVLRGPQGTLYGRNATAGVVNIISQKPKFVAEAKLSGDVSNFSSSRLEGMVNIPLVEDKVALRLAGAWTKRDGYAVNELTGNPIDGRDLWSTRLSLRIAPNDAVDVNLIWEHFEEDDDRLRSGKQLCKKDVVTHVAGMEVGYDEWMPNSGQGGLMATANANFSQGCERESLYSPDSYQTPMGRMLPYYVPLSSIGLPTALGDPYRSEVQTPDLRVIESTIDPEYRAAADLGELQISFDIGRGLTLQSETAYANDSVYSLQDFNRFNTAPGAWEQARPFDREGVLLPGPDGGIFCDPQLGCSDRLIAVDISTAESWQFSQEFRLSSDFEGPFNFSIGANYLRADSMDKYYVFINSISLKAALVNSFFELNPYIGGETNNVECLDQGYLPGDPFGVYPVNGCTYMDPNPIGSVNDEGHNYFLSKNPYKLISYAVFGEAYYNITDELKLTAGLRWTVDKKDAPRVPTWILANQSVGYPVADVIEQEWREPTGRLTLDWKPDLGFTDETMMYFSYAHGYKAGGANPPGFVRVFYADSVVAAGNASASATRPLTFDAEFVDAFEVGSKNTLADGRVTMNLAAFYYDYKDYQISEIVDRSAFNRNFDATVWGVELEADWRPLENLKLGFKGGYSKTRIADGEMAIDLMDRTAGDPNWMLVRPFPTFASSCIMPTWLMVGNLEGTPANPEPILLGSGPGGGPTGCEMAYVMGVDPVTGEEYVADPDQSTLAHTHSGIINYSAWNPEMADQLYPGWDPRTAPNNGEGIAKPLGGNELPNAPQWTATVTADYTIPLPSDWLATLHTDLHWQAESWWRVFNDHEFGRLDEYFTMNLAAIFTNEERGWHVMAYIKNVTDETAITGAFLNSDDVGLTTNVFLTEPRLYGLRVTKNWSGGPLLGGFGERREGPYPFTLELGGQVQRHDAPNETVEPFAASFPAPFDVGGDAQSQDLDWGDGRSVKLTWRPGGPWSVSAGARFGKTNGQTTAYFEQATDPVCAFGGPFAGFCAATDPKYQFLVEFSKTNRADASAYDREEHQIVDFAVHRDAGLGGLSRSTLGLGLRYARLESRTEGRLRGIPDWSIPEGFFEVVNPYGPPVVTRTVYDITSVTEREFSGVGPVASWEAAVPLLDAGDAGRVELDWSVSGGVLFGDRETALSADQRSYRVELNAFQTVAAGQVIAPMATLTDAPPVAISRSDDATVATLSASLGLSYSIGGFKAGAGYRWERYSDA